MPCLSKIRHTYELVDRYMRRDYLKPWWKTYSEFNLFIKHNFPSDTVRRKLCDWICNGPDGIPEGDEFRSQLAKHVSYITHDPQVECALCQPLNQGDFFVIERSAKFFDPKTLEELEIAQKANEIIGDLGGAKYHLGDYYIKELPQIIPQKDYYSVYARNSFYVFSRRLDPNQGFTPDQVRYHYKLIEQIFVFVATELINCGNSPSNPALAKTYRSRPSTNTRRRVGKSYVPCSLNKLLGKNSRTQAPGSQVTEGIMKNKKPIFPRGILVAILIAFISIVGIVTLTVLESQKNPSDLLGLWEDTVLGILCSVVASVVFAILTRIYSRNDSDVVEQRLQIIEMHLDRQNELYDSGIKSIRPKSHFDQEEDYWNGILSGSAIQLDLVGHSLSNWFGRRYRDTFIRKVRQIVSSGGTVNVVLSTPEPNSIGTMLSNVKTAYWHEQIKLSKVEKTLLEFYRLLKENIPEKDRCNLRIYVTDIEKVTYFYIRTDTQCIISPYTYSPGTKENIFLLELLPNTAHVKTLEDDFDAMIGNMTPLSFNLHNEEQRETGLWMEHRYSSKNNYKSRDWNREITNKFVFRDIHGIYEAGLFWHYLNKTFVKAVIELPVGFGCPSKCRYCASARIDGFYPLTAQQMQSMFEQLYRKII